MRVFIIPADQRFLPALAEGLLAQTPRDDPAALASYTLLLPTRRAARALDSFDMELVREVGKTNDSAR